MNSEMRRSQKKIEEKKKRKKDKIDKTKMRMFLDMTLREKN